MPYSGDYIPKKLILDSHFLGSEHNMRTHSVPVQKRMQSSVVSRVSTIWYSKSSGSLYSSSRSVSRRNLYTLEGTWCSTKYYFTAL